MEETPTMASMAAIRPSPYHSAPHNVDGISLAQREWGARPIAERLSVLARLRQTIASDARALAESIPTSLPGALHRTVADSLVAEVLPLLEACRYLEREADRILRPRYLGAEGKPLWLGRVETEIERLPWGTVLVLAAANYPLFLPGTQTLQALVAGNAVLWKPAPGTERPAHALRLLLLKCGLPPELLTVLDASIDAAQEAIAAGVDYVVLTGSAESGKAVAHQLAETLTPATMELSGCDAVFVLPGFDADRVIDALLFAERFNGSATCMAPRRLFLVGLSEASATLVENRLKEAMQALSPVKITPVMEAKLRDLIEDAREQGAEVICDGLAGVNSRSGDSGPGDTAWGYANATLIVNALPSLRAMQADIFAPLLSVMRVANEDEALAANAACPYALAASIFGPEEQARKFARRLRVGNLVLNNLILPTADPRIAFGGRGRSGYGVTRGAEGLLAMTTPRTMQSQRGDTRRSYEPTRAEHVDLFAAVAELLHGAGLRSRLRGIRQVIAAVRKLY